MASNKTHNWLITFDVNAIKHLRQLRPSARKGVFDVLRTLLRAENPLSVRGVKKLKGQQVDRVYRARSGDYRVLFTLTSDPVIHLKTEYKGTLHIEAIRHRSQAYRP